MKEKKTVAAAVRKGDGDIIKEKPEPVRFESEHKGKEEIRSGEGIKFDSKDIADEEPDFDIFYSPSSEPLLLEDIKEVEEIESNIIMEGEDEVDTAIANEEEGLNDEDETVS